MVNFMKFDFQASLSERMGIVQTKPVFFMKHFKSLDVIILQNQRGCVQESKLSRAVNIKIFNSKYLLFSLDLAGKSI